MDDNQKKIVSATFIAKYYHLLMTEPSQLLPMYMPGAKFNHFDSGELKGEVAIRDELRNCYPEQFRGRVTIQDMSVTGSSSSSATYSLRFSIMCRGSMLAKSSGDVTEFCHVIELEQVGEETFGILSDVLRMTRHIPLHTPPPPPQFDDSWAAETPPMFARPKVEEEPVPLEPLPSTIEGPPPPALSDVPSAASHPVATPLDSTTSCPTDTTDIEEPAAAEAAEDSKTSVTPLEEEPAELPTASLAQELQPNDVQPAPPPKPLSFAERLRNAQKPKSPPPQPSTNHATKGSQDGAATKAPAGKEQPKPSDGAARPSTNPRPTNSVKEERRVSRREDGDQRGKPIFYDAFVKGLPSTTTKEDISLLAKDVNVAVSHIKLQSQPDKKDGSVTRTFAFILFDHEQINAKGETVAQVVARLREVSKIAKVQGQRIFVEEVKEKFSFEAPVKH